MTARENSVSFFGADMVAKAEANRGNTMKVFDWDKAAAILKERGATYAEAGLASDWSCTGGSILNDGKPDKKYTYLASTWATPTMIVDDGDEIDCWIYETETEWDSGTSWPQSSLDIFNQE